jgi:hypothetical protein
MANLTELRIKVTGRNLRKYYTIYNNMKGLRHHVEMSIQEFLGSAEVKRC